MRINEEYKEWLYELGFDEDRVYEYGENEEMVRFMREIELEDLRAVQDYMDDIFDCSDDWYIEMKNRNNT